MSSIDQHRILEGESDRVQPYAPYGKACISCAKSKTRCAIASVGGKCERCHRLNKNCQPAPSVRKKRVSKKSSSTSSKTAALEERLDGLVQMLQRSQTSTSDIKIPQDQLQNQSVDSVPPTLPSSGVTTGSCNYHYVGFVQSNTAYGDSVATNHSSTTPLERLEDLAQQTGVTTCSKAGQRSQQELISRLTTHGGPLTPAASTASYSAGLDKYDTSTDFPPETETQLKDYLECYRINMVPYLPIVCLTQEMTLDEMRKQRPFLLLVIRAICSKNLDRQTALVIQIKKILGREMLLEAAKSLDLFLGILVFAGWCHLYICNGPIISTIIHLAMSLACDLSLTKPLPSESSLIMLNYTTQGCPKPITGVIPTRTMEERRAIVGLYLVSSVCANYFQRIELMRWTRYLDECLRLLEEKAEYPTDILLVYLTRVQLICNKGAASTINDLFGDTEMRVPADFYLKSLKSQLDELERSVPPNLKSNVTLKLHILNATTTIYERSLSSFPKAISSDPSDKLQCTENLWVCFTAVKSWFNIFFSLESIPLPSYTHFSMMPLTQMAHCLVALFLLSTFESPGVHWDRPKIWQEMDFGDIVQLVVDRWEQVPQANGIEISPARLQARDGLESEQAWFHAMRRILVVRNLWEAKVAAITAVDERGGRIGPDENGAVDGPEGSGMPPMDPLDFGAMNLDMVDDSWLRDMIGGGYDFGI